MRRERWRMKIIPVIRPGRVTEEKARVVEMRRLLEVEHSRELVKYVAFPKSGPEQAKKMRMNLKVTVPIQINLIKEENYRKRQKLIWFPG